MKTTPTLLHEPLASRRTLLHGAVLALLGSAGLAGCGGGGGPDESGLGGDTRKQALGGVDSGGTGSTARFFSAAIDSTMPLTLNGVTFDTDGSLIVDGDEQALDVQALLPGMSCQIHAAASHSGGTQQLARARRIQVAEQMLGPVTTAGATGSGFMVLGHAVALTAHTVFDNTLPAGLASVQPGLVVRVWGEFDPSGARIVATRVAAAPVVTAWVVRGVLTQLDRAAGLAHIGSLELHFSAGSAVADAIAADVQPGAVVRARISPNTTAALLSLVEDALHLPDHVQAEIEGRVTRLDSATRFALDGVEVDARSAPTLPGAAPLALGARAAVRGHVVRGVLLAEWVAIEPDEPLEFAGRIASTNPAQRSFVLKGITVVWSGATRFEGGNAKLLTPKRRAAVVGLWNTDRSQVQATRIHLEA